MKKERMYIPREKYLSAGVHIGMSAHNACMKRFIYKIRPDGLAVLNVGMLDKRIGYAANMLSDAKNILVVSQKENTRDAVKKFAEYVNNANKDGNLPHITAITDRFMPGSLTNP